MIMVIILVWKLETICIKFRTEYAGHAFWDICALFGQARRLICDRLAVLLSMSAPPQPQNIDLKSIKSDYKRGISREQENDETGRSNSTADGRALTSILSLLETRITIDNEERMKNDKTAKTRRDWMLATAVIDRLCFIVLLVIFVGGTLLFLFLFLR